MTKVIDINSFRVQCEACRKFYAEEDIVGHDEDGNPCCKFCYDAGEEVIEERYEPID